ncbi:hypothetical protein [Aquamicrobium sp. LC103]|uniref:hypothetical protein n=1 Tax=Aquamicrobium sp. LC103 TaxID=1120658 RepID=UPI00063E8116|nr:hypothetical protein [Aquamicrobium sp. LC103]TKT75318.1 hypothetical protein XW59_019490 [Aquamicrobium sp. LC103]
MALFSQIRDSIDLEDEVAALRKEVAALTKSLSKRGASAYRDTRHDAADVYADIADRFAHALPVVRKRAHRLEQSIKDNPGQTAAVVGLMAVCLAGAVLLFSRR